MTNPEQPASFSDDQSEGKEFAPATAAELAEFANEFGGEGKASLRAQLSSFLGRQDIDRQYPTLQAEDLMTYIQFVGQKSIYESRRLEELVENGTVYGGSSQLSLAGLDRYRLGLIDYHQVLTDRDERSK